MRLAAVKHAFFQSVLDRGYVQLFRRFLSAKGDDSGHSRPALTEMLTELARLEQNALLDQLESSPKGISVKQAEQIRARTGCNEVQGERHRFWLVHLWLCYCNPFNLLLTVLALIAFLTDDTKGMVVISLMVVVSTLLRFVQEVRSNSAAEQLKAMVTNTATVLRGQDAGAGAKVRYLGGVVVDEIPMSELVPGDVVQLSAGDMIPADLRILTAKDLFISQAALTGEALPVEKIPELSCHQVSDPFELSNLCFMGTNVISGSATGVVIGTGLNTFFGTLADRVSRVESVPTAFQAGVNRVSWLLIRFMLVMAPLVFFINGLTKGDWGEAALFALSIAVGLTPEMLPMIVTSTLAKGAVSLSRKKVVVKHLDAIQNFGAMDILCTDKTGTLTQDKIILERHTDVYGKACDDVLRTAYLNSYHQSGLKNLLDIAVLEHVELKGELGLPEWEKIDEIPFDFTRRRMSVVVAHDDEKPLLICKGALEEVLEGCNYFRHEGRSQRLTSEILQQLGQVTHELNEEGLRVVAVATRHLPEYRQDFSVADETGMTLVGYIAFLDPPKETTAAALRALQLSGVTPKILTGDNDRVTRKVCKDVGLKVEQVTLGHTLDSLTDKELAKVAQDTTVFAKLTPLHKERIVRILRDQGHVVGFLGDGINDAPALRSADIGISVDSAVDIAKEAADIILLEKSLLVLEEGVIEGRKTFANMLKYIKLTASSNFGNVFSVLVASAFIPFLPMLPIHLLVQNLLYDISQIAIPFDGVDHELLQQPQRWQPADLGRFMLTFGPISSGFDILTYLVMWFVFGANSAAHQTLFQSGWFVEGLLSQVLIVHMIRTRRIPFIQSCAHWPLLLMTGIIVFIGLILPMGPLAHYFSLQALPWQYFPVLLLILLSYMLLTQWVKGVYSRKYGWQ